MFSRAVSLVALFALLANLLLAVSATPVPDVDVEKRICLRSCKYVEGASVPFVTSTVLSTVVPSATEAASSVDETSIPVAVETSAPAAAETPDAASSSKPFITYAAAFPDYAKTNGASGRGPASAIVAAVTIASTLFFAL